MVDNTGGSTADEARLARRSLLKKAAIAGAAAWTAPMVIESVTNPAGALTCAAGDYHVVYQTTLLSRSDDTSLGCTHAGANVTPASVGMTAVFTGSCTTSDGGNSIAHIASNNGNCRPVRISVTGGCTCTITSVWAQVHMRGNGTCPRTGGEYCWSASATDTNAPLRVVGGALNSSTVTVQPNFVNNAICTGVNAAAGIHWGSPDAADGYLVVNINCTA